MSTATLYKQTIKELKDCYDTHASKFSSTRKKHRPEFKRIVNNIQKETHTPKQWWSILELGCWDWRLYPYLQESKIPISTYTGVDISWELLKIAWTHSPASPQTQRIVDDMLHHLWTLPSESKDIIICVASFQHLPDQKTRESVLQEIYRVLRYDGIFISIDWSWSQWMITTHRNLVLSSLRRSIYSLWKRERNNLFIPFHYNNTTKSRLYHIFTQQELKKLFKTQGLIVKEMIYSAQDWRFHNKLREARNICSIVKKSIEKKDTFS